MKLTVTFSPGDEAVHAALSELVPPERLDDLLFDLQAKADIGDPEDRVVGLPQELSYAETVDILHEVDRIAGRFPNHDEGCQALTLRRADLCDCDHGRLSRLMERLHS